MSDDIAWLRASEGGFGPEVAEAMLARMRAGESVRAICRDPAMPSADTVYRWVRLRPEFGARFAEARAQARETRAWRAEQRRLGRWTTRRRKVRGGPRSSYSEALADRVCFGLLEGVSLATVCRRRGMPAPATVYKWRRERPDFARAYQLAREMAVERILDEAFAVALAAGPEEVAEARLQVRTLEWKAARLAPKTLAR